MGKPAAPWAWVPGVTTSLALTHRGGDDVEQGGAALALVQVVLSYEVLLGVAGHLRGRPALHKLPGNAPPVALGCVAARVRHASGRGRAWGRQGGVSRGTGSQAGGPGEARPRPGTGTRLAQLLEADQEATVLLLTPRHAWAQERGRRRGKGGSWHTQHVQAGVRGRHSARVAAQRGRQANRTSYHAVPAALAHLSCAPGRSAAPQPAPPPPPSPPAPQAPRRPRPARPPRWPGCPGTRCAACSGSACWRNGTGPALPRHLGTSSRCGPAPRTRRTAAAARSPSLRRREV